MHINECIIADCYCFYSSVIISIYILKIKITNKFILQDFKTDSPIENYRDSLASDGFLYIQPTFQLTICKLAYVKHFPLISQKSPKCSLKEGVQFKVGMSVGFSYRRGGVDLSVFYCYVIPKL